MKDTRVHPSAKFLALGLAAAAGLAAFTAPTAQAAVILGFETANEFIAPSNNTHNWVDMNAPYQESGFTFTPAQVGGGLWPLFGAGPNSSDPRTQKSDFLSIGPFIDPSPTLTLTESSGMAFSLLSMEVGRFQATGSYDLADLLITGYLSAGGTVVRTISQTGDGDTPYVENVTFDSQWASLISVVFTVPDTMPTNVSSLEIDNIEVSAIPEPSTFALLALAGLGLLSRRR
jgi:hypothetical protein